MSSAIRASARARGATLVRDEALPPDDVRLSDESARFRADQGNARVAGLRRGRQPRECRPDPVQHVLDPQDLYAQNHAIGAPPDAAYTTKFFNRIKDVIDSYHPDLIFFDDTKLPLGDVGLNLAAHFYNANQKWHGGNLQAVIVSNGNSVVEQQAITNNLERNMSLDLLRIPWNKGSTVGPWHYSIADYNKGYAKSATWIHLIVDVVS